MLERADIDRIMGTTSVPRLRIAAITAVEPQPKKDT